MKHIIYHLTLLQVIAETTTAALALVALQAWQQPPVVVQTPTYIGLGGKRTGFDENQ